MKPLQSSFFFIVSLIALHACQPKANTSENAAQSAENLPEENTEPRSDEHKFTSREPTDDELNEFGLVTAIEDAAYPMFIVSVSFPERQQAFDFNLNVEGAELSHDWPEFVEKYVTLYYEIKESYDVLDLQVNGVSTQGEYAPEIDPEWDRLTGKLIGADGLSGDLPSVLSLESADGRTIAFEYFVDDEVMKVNGKEVEIFFVSSEKEEITYMELSPDS